MRFLIRNLELDDCGPNYFNLLGQLTSVSELTLSQYTEFINSLGPNHQVHVIIDTSTNQIVGTGTIFIECKLIHGLGKVAHIEDIVTDVSYRSQGLGLMLIKHLVQIAEQMSCYKVILDCSEHNVGFYSKCGFDPKGIQMAKYF